MNSSEWERIFEERIRQIASAEDPAHDLMHFRRVVRTAKRLCAIESGKIEVVVPAAWLHDFVIIPKNDPRRSEASTLAAQEAVHFLKEVQYPEQYHAEIFHAIECHSFSANKETKTLEAAIVQDADRLDGVGAIGIARCFATAGLMRRAFYSETDPFCTVRAPVDSEYTIDHFYKKLFKTIETLKTKSGQEEGRRRSSIMAAYLADLQREI